MRDSDKLKTFFESNHVSLLTNSDTPYEDHRSMMYFTRLPDHKAPGFNERLHFGNFQQHNIVFNAEAGRSHCDHHVGCLSIKTVLSGEEVYGFNGLEKAV